MSLCDRCDCRSNDPPDPKPNHIQGTVTLLSHIFGVLVESFYLGLSLRQYLAAVSNKAIQTTFFAQGSQMFKIREKCDEAYDWNNGLAISL